MAAVGMSKVTCLKAVLSKDAVLGAGAIPILLMTFTTAPFVTYVRRCNLSTKTPSPNLPYE